MHSIKVAPLKTKQAHRHQASNFPVARRLSQDLNTAPTDVQHEHNAVVERRIPGIPVAAPQENHMYLALITLVFASTIFTPSFIGIRARTNANWRSL